MFKKTSRIIARTVGALVVVLAIVTAYLVHRGHDTLRRLLNPGESAKATEILSRWLALRTDGSLTWGHTVAYLDMTGYRSMSTDPTEPGDYRSDFPTLTIFVRP